MLSLLFCSSGLQYQSTIGLVKSGKISITEVPGLAKIKLVSPAPCKPTIHLALLNNLIWSKNVSSDNLIISKFKFFNLLINSCSLIIFLCLASDLEIYIFFFEVLFKFPLNNFL